MNTTKDEVKATETATLPYKTERAAKLALAKILRRYDAKQDEICERIQSNREHGYREGDFDAEQALRAEKCAIYDEMVALRDACKKVGWYVSNAVIRFAESPTAELIRNNMD